MEQELINALMPYIISASATIIAAVGAWLGTKLKGIMDTKEKKDIIEQTIKYVEQVGKTLGSEAKLQLAKEKAVAWMDTKGLKVSEVELDILIEAFVNDLYGHSGLFQYLDREEKIEPIGVEVTE